MWSVAITAPSPAATAVEQSGLVPRRPRPGEPNYDLAWEAADRIVVAEVTSITPENEERQLRLASGQVVRYRHQLGAGERAVRGLKLA